MSIYDDAKNLHLGFPRNYIALSRGFTSSHRGIDMCWSNDYGGPYAPVYAPGDGEVVALVDGWNNTWSTGVSSWGNYVKIKHATNIYTLSAHMLKGSFKVKIGDKVKRGQMLGQMDNSGYSNGCHVHFEVYVGGSGTSYRVDPLKYCYAYPGDVIHKDEKGSVMTYTPITRFGTPVARNNKVDQIEVIAHTLRARKSPSLKGEILGYTKEGFYNAKTLEPTVADGYKWYPIEDFWCANDSQNNYLTILPKKVVQFDVSMSKLSKEQKDELQAWCKERNIDLTIKEL